MSYYNSESVFNIVSRIKRAATEGGWADMEIISLMFRLCDALLSLVGSVTVLHVFIIKITVLFHIWTRLDDFQLNDGGSRVKWEYCNFPHLCIQRLSVLRLPIVEERVRVNIYERRVCEGWKWFFMLNKTSFFYLQNSIYTRTQQSPRTHAKSTSNLSVKFIMQQEKSENRYSRFSDGLHTPTVSHPAHACHWIQPFSLHSLELSQGENVRFVLE